ncbi:MAG: hypothetical protein M1114_02445 [Candidatus Dependentiae bacterium]|nr:hypothetical protein [Candidatus Dependentiae bacterium]
MKKLVVLLTLATGSLVAADVIVIDRIEAVVLGPESSDVITLSDTKRPGIDGRIRTLDARIDERKMYQNAVSSKLVSSDEVEKALNLLMKDNNLSIEARDQVFREAGYDPEEGRKEFEVMTGVNNLMGMKVSGKVIVPHKEIVEQYNKNPEMLEESYYLQRAEFPIAQAASASDLRQQLKDHKIKPRWSQSYWIDRSEMDEKKAYIFDMPKGQLYIDKNKDSYELIRLVDKKERRPKPLDDKTYAEIRGQLQQDKWTKQLELLRAELDEESAVVRF